MAAILNGYIIPQSNVATAIENANTWQGQAVAIAGEVFASKEEIRKAWHDHGIAQGYLNCMVNLELISRTDASRFYQELLCTEEKLNRLGRGVN